MYLFRLQKQWFCCKLLYLFMYLYFSPRVTTQQNWRWGRTKDFGFWISIRTELHCSLRLSDVYFWFWPLENTRWKPQSKFSFLYSQAQSIRLVKELHFRAATEHIRSTNFNQNLPPCKGKTLGFSFIQLLFPWSLQKRLVIMVSNIFQ